ncbi:killer cell lectin-like receptor subfamily B member 1A isoform X4 [Erpetoichthys calabaricus]|uniref:killer cell lectin-like receptor subfamily B member 1A isoform X4 n=1 Tax=Erpetoichthys calabaricus TaxID=27687 RepID=UPI0022349130|nr:killer cell lectin-like receptor subfamily B member 1A isoform X4 [Erpetoichthys calabaricus]
MQDRCLKIVVIAVVVFLFVAAGTAIIAIKLVENQPKCCPVLWVLNKENCYYFSTNKTTWQMSKDDCTSREAQLAVTEDEEELRFLILECRFFLGFWIGLKRNSQQEWRWINERPVNPTWMNQTDQDRECALLEKESIYSYNCSHEKHWICKMRAKHL